MNNIKTISTQELLKKIKNNSDTIIINVLERKYFDDCHIQSSINIPHDELLEKTASWDKDKEIVVYCANATCPKSIKAYEILTDIGFNKVYDYKGGIAEWFKSGQQTSGSCSLEYLRITA